MRPDERLERITALVDDLRTENANVPILVEGKRDREALTALGCTGLVLLYNEGDSLVGAAERLTRSHRRVILLLDWDRTGGTLHHRLREGLEANGVRCDERFRRELAHLVSKETKSVEGLPGFLERLRARVGHR